MSIKDSYNKNTQDTLEDKIDKLTITGKVAARDKGLIIGCSNHRLSEQKKCNKVDIFMTCIIMIEEIIKIGADQMVATEEIITDKVEIDPRYEQNHRRGNVRSHQNVGRQNSREGYRGSYRNENYNRERGRSRSRERSF